MNQKGVTTLGASSEALAFRELGVRIQIWDSYNRTELISQEDDKMEARDNGTGANNQKPIAQVPYTPDFPAPKAVCSREPNKGQKVLMCGLIGLVLFICVISIGGLGLAWLLHQPTKPPQNPPTSSVTPTQTPVTEEKEADLPTMSPQVRDAVKKATEYLQTRTDEILKNQVNVDWLTEDQTVGRLALSGLALLEAGVPPDDPTIQNVRKTVRACAFRVRHGYSISTMLFYLNRLDEIKGLDEVEIKVAKSLALRLASGQVSNGFWDYDNPPINLETEADLVKKMAADGYKPERPGKSGDSSQTQFALLALWGSRRYQLPIEPTIYAAADYFHKTQRANGTWCYGAGEQWPDSNTCAGLLALAMAKAQREDRKFRRGDIAPPPPDPKGDEQVARAFKHITKVIGKAAVKHIPGGDHQFIHANSNGDLYFLWSLERVAVIYDLDNDRNKIDGKDWYDWGSKAILLNQKDDGSWLERDVIADTCFAILFLTRSNLARDLTESIRIRREK